MEYNPIGSILSRTGKHYYIKDLILSKEYKTLNHIKNTIESYQSKNTIENPSVDQSTYNLGVNSQNTTIKFDKNTDDFSRKMKNNISPIMFEIFGDLQEADKKHLNGLEIPNEIKVL